MKILVALPKKHNFFNSIEEVLDGKIACSGTYGSIIRLASLLSEVGFNVCLSAQDNIKSTKFPCIKHEEIDVKDFDCFILHQSHWDGISLTFGNQILNKTILWLHTFIPFSLVYTFLKEGGKQVVCVSEYHANFYRALPQWQEGISIIYNTYSSVFKPTNFNNSNYGNIKPKLLFIGAISRDKGFCELTKIWSYLANQGVNLELAISGSASVHTLSKNQTIGSMGIGDTELEEDCIKPWLKSLPKDYQPTFLGALSPLELRNELKTSWAAIVNPGCISPETFCVSAVEAQACERTVFSVSFGALKETVYCKKFNSLDENRQIGTTAERIIAGLKQKELVNKNGYLSAQFVEEKFASSLICKNWINLIVGNKIKTLPNTWLEVRDLANDLMRFTKTGMFIHKLRYSTNRQIMKQYLLTKK